MRANELDFSNKNNRSSIEKSPGRPKEIRLAVGRPSNRLPEVLMMNRAHHSPRIGINAAAARVRTSPVIAVSQQLKLMVLVLFRWWLFTRTYFDRLFFSSKETMNGTDLKRVRPSVIAILFIRWPSFVRDLVIMVGKLIS